MNRFRIKVCGITRPADARLVADLGGDMIGMIFYKGSPRFVTKATAGKIIADLSPLVSRVGVFVEEKIEIMLRLADSLQLDFIQLHGHSSDRVRSRLQREGYKVIQSFPVKSRADFKAIRSCRADLRLLDNQTEREIGGTGRTFDWELKPGRKIANLMLAGGITADNVQKGIGLFQPLVVDVNSGVESRPGIKSRAKLNRFFTECDRIRYGS